MKLREYKNKYHHYFRDERGQLQGEYAMRHESGQHSVICHYKDGYLHGERRVWHKNGQQIIIAHYRNGKYHGEYKRWDSSGELRHHTFDIDGEEIIDFLENPERHPITEEEKLIFTLKYGTGLFIDEVEKPT